MTRRMPARYIGVTEAASLLDVVPSTVRAAIKRGRLRAERFGHIWMIEGPSLEVYAATRRRSGGPARKVVRDG